MESQPQNPEFRSKSENFHPCKYYITKQRPYTKNPHTMATAKTTSFTALEM